VDLLFYALICGTKVEPDLHKAAQVTSQAAATRY